MFTLGSKQPTLRRDSIDHLDRSICCSIKKAKKRLEYKSVADQHEAIKRTKDWAVSNLGVRDLSYQAHQLVDSTLPALNS
jgi:sterol-4alpha-carboxylate 3-dehydrogenase (decarboxylating)